MTGSDGVASHFYVPLCMCAWWGGDHELSYFAFVCQDPILKKINNLWGHKCECINRVLFLFSLFCLFGKEKDSNWSSSVGGLAHFTLWKPHFNGSFVLWSATFFL